MTLTLRQAQDKCIWCYNNFEVIMALLLIIDIAQTSARNSLSTLVRQNYFLFSISDFGVISGDLLFASVFCSVNPLDNRAVAVQEITNREIVVVLNHSGSIKRFAHHSI